MHFRPHRTELFGNTTAPALFSVGTTWQDQTLELGAIVINADWIIRRIEHVARRDLGALSTKQQYRVGGSRHIIALRPAEYVTELELRYAPLVGVTAIRLRTNMAPFSPWIGGSSGVVGESIKAPPGYFLNALYGSHNGQFVTKLGGLCCPLSMVLPPTIYESKEALEQSPHPHGAGLFDGEQRGFLESSDDVTAVIVRCDIHVERLWVLSSVEWCNLRAFQDDAPLGANEHCVELLKGESIERVDVLSHHVVNAVRFLTNQRLTPWYGRTVEGRVKSFHCGSQAEGGRCFAGFHGSIGERYVGSLAVVWTRSS